MTINNFKEIFDEFFSISTNMMSTLKGVFLYALTDIHFHNDPELIERDWISFTADKIIVNLDFIAIRMARYYWDVMESKLQDMDPLQALPSKDIKIKKIIKDKDDGHIPELKELESDDYAQFRKDIVKDGMREILKNLKTDKHDWYEVDTKKNTFTTHKSVTDYFNDNIEEFKSQLKKKVCEILEKYNSGSHSPSNIRSNSPFELYLKKHTRSVFGIAVKDTKIENIKTKFPDKYGIIDNLRKGNTNNYEFLKLTLQSYDILSQIRGEKLAISESLKTNANVSIYDHQLFAALKIKNNLGGSAILADEVGLGKTIEAGIIIKEFLTTGLAQKVLILAPPSLLSQWQDELVSKFNLDFINQNDKSRFTSPDNHDLLIMSHSSAIYPKQSDPLMNQHWDLVVVDEAHSMKNSQTYKHKLVRELSKRNLLLLTATPLQNNLEELYNLIDLLRPGYLGTWNNFQRRYMVSNDARTFNPMFKDELQKTLSELIIRTRREEVKKYIKFKDRIPNTKILEPTEDESLLYDSITDIVRSLYFEQEKSLPLMIYQRLASSSTNSSRRALYKMKMNGIVTEEEYLNLIDITNRIKIDTKMSEMLGLVKTDPSKFLIFTEFLATQDYIAEMLVNHGHSVTLFNGKMNYEEKNESIKRFKNNAQIMISTSAGGEGQNFQFCHNVVNYDLPWNPMKVEQRIGRVHRIGQENDVKIFNFAINGTIEGYILELLYVKIQLFQMALGDMDLLFEDSWEGGSQHTWFKEYMTGKTKEEIKNKFTALGDDWSNRKHRVNDAIQDFNQDVFANFNLSSLSEIEHESSN